MISSRLLVVVVCDIVIFEPKRKYVCLCVRVVVTI